MGEHEQAGAAPGPGDGAADDLQHRNRELAAAVAARDAFLAVVAHELRNPMTPIVGHVQRLRRQVAAGACDLAAVADGLGRIEWLIDLYLKRATTLLDVSRITSGKLRLEAEDTNVSELAQTIADGLEPAAEHAGSRIDRAIEPGLRLLVDRLALEQILDNLLLNAVKYGARAPIALAVSRSGGALRIEVSDRGIGMSEADRTRIFQPFERAITYGSQAGFGVGLWVVRQLVDAMQGQIEVESAPDAGTTFTVTLPLAASPASP